VYVPRPEYPRPDFERGGQEGVDWLNLNGAWQFAFDPADRGLDDRWAQAGDESFPLRQIVPFPWESAAAWGRDRERRDWSEDWLVTEAYLDPASVTMENYREAPRHTVGWYRRTVDIPAGWAGRRAFLSFGAVDHYASVFINGRLAGEHEGGYTPFSVDITDLVLPGSSAVITVRAEDPQDHRRQPGGKQHNWYQRTSGIWQPVFLEPRGQAYIENAHIRPDTDEEVARVTVFVGGTTADVEVVVTIHDPDGEPIGTASAAAPEAGGAVRLTVPVPSPQLWDTNDPNLYVAEVSTRSADAVEDTVSVPFGMRRISRKVLPGTDHEYVWLNDRPVYLRGVLDQAFTPWGIHAYRSEEEIIGDLEAALNAGFNFIRLHIKIDDPVLLHHADRLGVLLMADMPNFDEYCEESCARYETMLREALARDMNHPSIFAYVLFNETWGLGGHDYKNLPDRQEWVRSMVGTARELDGTRLVEDNSPCLHDHVETDLNTWHYYINDYQGVRDHIRHVVEQSYPGSQFNCVPAARQTTAPLMNSEYGGISANMGDMDVSWCFRYQTNELRLHERICGYVYTELTDLEWERNGVVNYDRTPKNFGYDLADINAADVLLLDGPPARRVDAGAEVCVPCVASLFSGERREGARVHWQLDVVDALDQTQIGAREGSFAVAAPSWRVTPLGDIRISMPDDSCLVQLRARLEDAEGALLGRNFLWFDVRGGHAVLPQPAIVFRPRDAVVQGLGDAFRRDGEVQGIVGGTGKGSIALAADLPQRLDLARVRAVTLIAELAACRASSEQTDDVTYPSDVKVFINGEEIGELTLPDSPADARGVISYLNGIPGRYGHRAEVKVAPGRLQRVLKRLKSGRCELRIAVVGEGRDANGLAAFFRDAGRLPMDPTLLFTVGG